MPYSIAEKAEILPGMELKLIDGVQSTDWESVRLSLASKTCDTKIKVGVTQCGSAQVEIKSLDLNKWNCAQGRQDPVIAFILFRAA